MGIESALVNTLTNEYLDVRGFTRFSINEVRAALGSRETTRDLVHLYANRPGEQVDAYRVWLTNLLLDFGARGGASPFLIELCHDGDYDGELFWGQVVDTMTMIGSVHDFDPNHPERLYPPPR